MLRRKRSVWRAFSLFASFSLLLVATAASAATIAFTLEGNAGSGLRAGNEYPPVTGGSGGILTVIEFDTTTNLLTIDIGWGSGNGFTDLTGPAVVGHIHGATANPAPTGFSENAPAIYDLHTLSGWNPSHIDGGFDGVVTILETDEAALIGNRMYINVHTLVNPNGEIRGHLVAVPEPTAGALVGLGLVLLAARRRR